MYMTYTYNDMIGCQVLYALYVCKGEGHISHSYSLSLSLSSMHVVCCCLIFSAFPSRATSHS